jgi:hypothetical protein
VLDFGQREFKKYKNMGICASDVELLKEVLRIAPTIVTVCELGSQNLYIDNDPKPPFASGWYQKRGLKYHCIDMAGDNEAYNRDLSRPIKDINKRFDLVTDFGTSEHVVSVPEYQSVAFHDGHINSVYPKEQPTEQQISEGFYNCWKNKDDLLKAGGLMVNVNPKTGNWKGHGYTYLDTKFYEELCRIMRYEIVSLFEHPAMGNTEDGWNIVCVLRKKFDLDFISLKTFSEITVYRS